MAKCGSAKNGSIDYANVKFGVSIIIALLLLLSGCYPVKTLAPATPLPTAIITPVPTASPTLDASGLPSDQAATLASLEKLSDYPLYVMHYAGEYPYPRFGLSVPSGAEFACSLFAALGDGRDKYYGRNFDWEFSPALLLFTDPPDGYASVSMVDLGFLSIDETSTAHLTDLPLADRTGLLSAPSMPFDGMNEYGLTIGMAAVPDEYIDDTSYNPSRQAIGSIGIIRQVLDHARTVDEAVEIFSQYNLDFTGGPPIHYLLADPSGKAILVEFYENEMVQLPNQSPWHIATNHLRCIAEGDGGCYRYATISEQLSTSNGQLDAEAAMQLLADVQQSSTQWSVVYNMTSGDVTVALGGEYDTLYSVHLDILKP